MEYLTVLHLSLFCSNIQVLVYDIRANKPYHVQDHHYGLPINSVAFHSGQGLVLSTDTKALKIWSRDKVGSPRLSHTCGGLLGRLSCPLDCLFAWSNGSTSSDSFQYLYFDSFIVCEHTHTHRESCGNFCMHVIKQFQLCGAYGHLRNQFPFL